ncbi:MAG: 5-formyltetrahydrofolate cyclo-ligase [Frankiaceae bacterium]|nr:5-formyltetrahydrofolate cyclo-ligase [Frankiaceae bacterium]
MTKGAKRAMRLGALQRRFGLPVDARDGAATQLSDRLLALDVLAKARTVAAYWPFGSEPSPVPALEALHARGVTVLLPVGRANGDLDWAPYTGLDGLGAGAWRFAEPSAARVGADAIASVDAVIVPALAVDVRGQRLGRGSGFYDRSLSRVPAGVPIIAIVYDEEVLDEVPTEAHDRPVTVIVTPLRTVVVT